MQRIMHRSFFHGLALSKNKKTDEIFSCVNESSVPTLEMASQIHRHPREIDTAEYFASLDYLRQVEYLKGTTEMEFFSEHKIKDEWWLKVGKMHEEKTCDFSRIREGGLPTDKKFSFHDCVTAGNNVYY